MAKVFITEYEAFKRDAKGQVIEGANQPFLAQQVVAITGASVQSVAFNAATTFIRISADAIASFEIGANPTATANSDRLPANWPEIMGVRGGDKIAVITNT